MFMCFPSNEPTQFGIFQFSRKSAAISFHYFDVGGIKVGLILCLLRYIQVFLMIEDAVNSPILYAKAIESI